MKKQLKVSFLFTLISTISLGVIYPILLTGVGLIIPSLSRPALLLQPVHKDDLFQGRPSMSGGPYSGASNLSLTSLELQKQVNERLKRLTADFPGVLVPRDLLFASASGYDADISVEGAMNQILRIAKARNMDNGILEQLVRQHIHPKLWEFIGSEKVNVVELNQALDKLMVKSRSFAATGEILFYQQSYFTINF